MTLSDLENGTPQELETFLAWAIPTPEQVAGILVNAFRRLAEQDARIQRLEAEARKRAPK